MVSLAYRAGVFLRASAGLMRALHLGLSNTSSFIMTPTPSVSFVTCPTSLCSSNPRWRLKKPEEGIPALGQNTPALWAIASLIRRRFHAVVDFPAHSCVALALPSLTNSYRGLFLRPVGGGVLPYIRCIGMCRPIG